MRRGPGSCPGNERPFCPAVRKHLGPWGSPDGGAQTLRARRLPFASAPGLGGISVPSGGSATALLQEGRTARAWGGGLARACPAGSQTCLRVNLPASRRHLVEAALQAWSLGQTRV